jgi:hypothetical protein
MARNYGNISNLISIANSISNMSNDISMQFNAIGSEILNINMIFESQYRIKTALLILLQTSFQYLIQQKLLCIHIWFGDFDEFAMYA